MPNYIRRKLRVDLWCQLPPIADWILRTDIYVDSPLRNLFLIFLALPYVGVISKTDDFAFRLVQ